MALFIVHPRVEASLCMGPGTLVYPQGQGIEAATEGSGKPTTLLEFLQNYDYRGSNQFQEEENLEFLRLYLKKYPQIMESFPKDILIPTEWPEYTDT